MLYPKSETMSVNPDIVKCLNTLNSYNVNIIGFDQNNEMPVIRAKKRRLDHLSWDEKIQRKKLKNRVAAQTSRDRKKAKIEQMETTIQELFDKNESLMKECENLRAINARLTSENEQFQAQLTTGLYCSNCKQNRSVECVVERGSAETLLRPRGTATHSAAILPVNRDSVTALWKIVLACLLYQTCSTSLTEMSILHRWNKSHRASLRISQETWKRLLRQQIIKNRSLVDQKILLKWWGRHQKGWNPVDVKA